MAEIRYCLNASTIRPVPLLEKIRIAAETGYAAIELWSNELGEFQEGGGALTTVRQALEDGGLAVPTVIALFGWLGTEGEEHRRALDEAKRKLEQAAAVGAERMIASPPRDPVDLSRAGEQYRELLELGEQFGVWPAMEYLGFVRSVYQIAQAWEIVQAAEHPQATIVMDPFHILRGGSPLEEIEQVPGERVAIWHWNDIPDTKPVGELTDADRVMPGDGVAPLEEIAQRAKRTGYRGYVSLELFNAQWWERDPRETARVGLERLRQTFPAE
ncbi:MAG: hypothetical protein KatS3mg115_1261 [Candidatus Poribacteria bacterium]|nr:MAG: hypothetical protein KatS3mg115_1261 [Candidatus Poribacteria bacterium]